MLNKLIIFYAKNSVFYPLKFLTYSMRIGGQTTNSAELPILLFRKHVSNSAETTWTAFPQTCVKFSRGYWNGFSANKCQIQQRLLEQLFRKQVSNSAEATGTAFPQTCVKFSRDYWNGFSTNMCQIQQRLQERLFRKHVSNTAKTTGTAFFHKHVSNSAETTGTTFPQTRVKFGRNYRYCFSDNTCQIQLRQAVRRFWKHVPNSVDILFSFSACQIQQVLF